MAVACFAAPLAAAVDRAAGRRPDVAAALGRAPRSRASVARSAAASAAAHDGAGAGFKQGEGEQKGIAGRASAARRSGGGMRILRLRRAAAASDVDAAAAAGGTPVSPTKTNEEPGATRNSTRNSTWDPVVVAVSKLLAPVTFGLFGIYFLQSSLHRSLSAALRSSDVFTTAFLAFVGWAFNKYLESVTKRFDAVDAALRELARKGSG